MDGAWNKGACNAPLRANIVMTQMAINSNRHHRKSIRLKGYDYSQAGLYFITICTHDRSPLFGEIVEGQMRLNDLGVIAHNEWNKTQAIRTNVVLHDFVIMPNHLHGIIEISISVGVHCMNPDYQSPNELTRQQGRVQRAPTIGDIVRGYKSSVTKRLKELLGTSNQRFWQRNYYEHIIRNESAYLKIAEYIQTNPQRWLEDTYHV